MNYAHPSSALKVYLVERGGPLTQCLELARSARHVLLPGHLLRAARSPRPGQRAGWELRLATFETAVLELAQLADGGQLQRGLRAILAHHLIFPFNRAGLAASEQSALSYLAEEGAIQPPIVSNVGPAGGAASLEQTGITIAPTTINDEAARLPRSGADAVGVPVRQVVVAGWSDLRSGRVRDCW